MLDMRQRGTGVTIGGLVPSLLLSLLASVAATYLLRQFLSIDPGNIGTTQEGEHDRPRSGSVRVAVPVVVLTIVSNNRWAIGRRGMPPPFFLPFLLARLVRQKRQQKQSGWQRWRR